MFPNHLFDEKETNECQRVSRFVHRKPRISTQEAIITLGYSGRIKLKPKYLHGVHRLVIQNGVGTQNHSILSSITKRQSSE